MKPTNENWVHGGDAVPSLEGQYSAEASCLGLKPGEAPTADTPDPWGRTGHRWFEKKGPEGELTHWTCVVRTPQGKAVYLSIWND